nr:Rieske 2Fe-2S domain-containing protein [Pseudomonas aeruginosa]
MHALVNACQHRGATTLVRVGKGNQSTFTCPFHAWCYKNDGRLVKVKAPGEYPEGFDKATRGLKKARIQSYRGFVFVSLDVAGEDDLVDFLGDARCSSTCWWRSLPAASWKCCPAPPPTPTKATGSCRTRMAWTAITSAQCTTTT